MSNVFSFSELDELAADLEKEPAEVRRAARDASIKVGREVKRRASADAPRDRPWLATQGIRQKTWADGNGSHTDIFTVPDSRGRPVGFFVEYGTSKQAPQPFLTPQMNWAGPEFVDELMKRVRPLEG